jgi:hypothetical protein
MHWGTWLLVVVVVAVVGVVDELVRQRGKTR